MLATPAAARDDPAAYLRARAAAAAGDGTAAVAAYRIALTTDASPTVARSAYREAVQAGDWALVRRALAILVAADSVPPDAALVMLADAVAGGRERETDAALARLDDGPFDFMAPIARVWMAADRRQGDPQALLAAGEPALVKRYAPAVRAQLLVVARRYDEAVAAARAQGEDALGARWAVGRLLAGRSERARATALLGRDPGPGAKATLAFGVAQQFLLLADDLGGQGAATIPVLLARSALLLQPDDDRARIVLAENLIRDGAANAALTVLDAVSPTGPFAEAARDGRVQASASAGDATAALTAARVPAEARGAAPATIARYGDYLMGAEHYADAVVAYQRARAASVEPATATDELRLGTALDQAGRWPDARPYLARALELAPGDAEVLNAVGYARIERGEDLAASLDLLQRALRARPDSVAILDSVGWAHFLTGDASRALALLERAAVAEDSGSVINEHLGDVYWALGRRVDARYAWSAATIGANEVAKVRLAVRAERGPPPRR